MMSVSAEASIVFGGCGNSLILGTDFDALRKYNEGNNNDIPKTGRNLSKYILGACNSRYRQFRPFWFVWSQKSADPIVTPKHEEVTVYTPKERSVGERTNTWFSSLYRRFPSAPLFVFPGSYQFTEMALSTKVELQSVLTEKTLYGKASTRFVQ
ncbi:MAG: hypothetical protein IPJ68_00010 [Candidatus Moraniibacteriota bacterium]|nr:MAG: hypothetical protein IPJ68_00010 [Candidatus Moranbacteria bacterium]